MMGIDLRAHNIKWRKLMLIISEMAKFRFMKMSRGNYLLRGLNSL